jgi:putative oxidoreductase
MSRIQVSAPFFRSHALPTTIPLAPLAGRILLSTIFVISGMMKFAAWQATADYMASKGMPLIPLLLPAAGILEIIGGAMVFIGAGGRWAALALFLYLIPTTLTFHNFWAYEGMEQQNQMFHFLKNLAVMGGLAFMVGMGSGPVSVDESVPLIPSNGRPAR